MPRPTIKDIIVVAELTKHEKDGSLQTVYPIGEAPIAGETHERMTATERADMEERLFHTINDLTSIPRGLPREHFLWGFQRGEAVSSSLWLHAGFIPRVQSNLDSKQPQQLI